MVKISPLAPIEFPKLLDVPGESISSGKCGIKATGKLDLFLAEFCENTVASGVFTNSATAAPSVEWGKRNVKNSNVRGLVVNSGNANAFTGLQGDLDVKTIANVTAGLIGCEEDKVLVAQTGLIGEALRVDCITSKLPELHRNLGSDWQGAATAICTTDTYQKGSSKSVVIDGQTVSITGIAKGSGMIAPDLATMLAFIFTDVSINKSELENIVQVAVDKTFNSITVDSDTSTNDMVLAFATCQAKNSRANKLEFIDMQVFCDAVYEVMLDLAHQIVRDGEGAQKFIEVRISGAETDVLAKSIALEVANSPLVKTAVAGEDPNWGRVVMAIGKSGIYIDKSKLCIAIGGYEVARNGIVAQNYDEKQVATYMMGDNIIIEAELGVGEGCATVWTCDLTHGYISINADYRS